jgi:hypothetical protein
LWEEEKLNHLCKISVSSGGIWDPPAQRKEADLSLTENLAFPTVSHVEGYLCQVRNEILFLQL